MEYGGFVVQRPEWDSSVDGLHKPVTFSHMD